jgi:small subunit ribosomal protein S6
MSDRQYELVYILPPETTEQQSRELHEQIASIVSRMNGQIEKTENWGRRKLAYEIGHFKEGVYLLEVINGSGELMKELDIHDIASLTRYAIRMGVVSPDA